MKKNKYALLEFYFKFKENMEELNCINLIFAWEHYKHQK